MKLRENRLRRRRDSGGGGCRAGELLCYALLDNWVPVRYSLYAGLTRIDGKIQHKNHPSLSLSPSLKSRPMTVHADITGHYHNCCCIMAIFNFAALSIDPPKWLHCYYTVREKSDGRKHARARRRDGRDEAEWGRGGGGGGGHREIRDGIHRTRESVHESLHEK